MNQVGTIYFDIKTFAMKKSVTVCGTIIKRIVISIAVSQQAKLNISIMNTILQYSFSVCNF